MRPLPNSEKLLLLEAARRSIVHAVQHPASTELLSADTNSFLSPGAFVTLHRRGRLRGCIGQIGAPQPILLLVVYCARAAALEDPRFRPVEPHEIPEIEIELSILSALEVIKPEQIEIGKHGLMLTAGTRRGLLLPQVAAQHGWSSARFLEETCVKAGLDRCAWRAEGTQIDAFTAEVFSESELHLAASAAAQSPAAE